MTSARLRQLHRLTLGVCTLLLVQIGMSWAAPPPPPSSRRKAAVSTIRKGAAPPPSTRTGCLALELQQLRAQSIHGLDDLYRSKVESGQWDPAPGTFDRFVGYKPSHPKDLEGSVISGYTVAGSELTRFDGRVLYVHAHPDKPGAYRAVYVEEGTGARKSADLTGARMVVVAKGSLPPGSQPRPRMRALQEGDAEWIRGPTPLDRRQVADVLKAARDLPVHTTEAGRVKVNFAPDGTLLLPQGIWKIDGKDVPVPATAYRPSAPGLAEIEGLRAIEASGYQIVEPMKEGGTRFVYVVQKAGKKYVAKIPDPERIIPKDAFHDPASGPMTPEIEAQWRALCNEFIVKMLNREVAMEADLAHRGFNPLKGVELPDLAVRGIRVMPMVGEMDLGQALKQYPELEGDREYLRRAAGLVVYDSIYAKVVNADYYGLMFKYEGKTGEIHELGIDMKPHSSENRWDNTRVNVQVIPGYMINGREAPRRVRITHAWDVDF